MTEIETPIQETWDKTAYVKLFNSCCDSKNPDQLDNNMELNIFSQISTKHKHWYLITFPSVWIKIL